MTYKPRHRKPGGTVNMILPYLKAYAALIGSVATALLAVYAEESSTNHWLTVVAVACTAVATWAVPNLDPKATHQDESVQPPRGERGAVDIAQVLLILVVLVFLVWLLQFLFVGRGR